MSFDRKETLRVALLAIIVSLGWSLYTMHAWEDYYITFRAAKNLATGHGLVFTEGERLHTFTSPLGVLLPALSSLLVANQSDVAALWVFRFMCIGFYATGAVVLWRLLRSTFASVYPAVVGTAFFLTDAKIVDFSTNGMETSFLLLFLLLTLHALYRNPPRQAVQLGLAWAGLMWSRPDSFIYIAVLAIGTLCFKPAERFFADRARLIKTFVLAGVVTALVYLPWFLWAWWYYGSPVPHTIVAKGLMRPAFELGQLWSLIENTPLRMVLKEYSFAGTFMPPYGHDEYTGWPPVIVSVYRLVAVLLSLVWLLPVARWEARVASLGFAAGHFYLMHFASFHYPWYFPTITLLGFVVMAFLVGQGWDALAAVKAAGGSESRQRAIWRTVVIGPAALLLVAVGLSLAAAYQLRTQQRIIEDGQRTSIGRWLRENAQPKDTVFLEPLGYIGYYSNLKMLDFPGLASAEMVQARKKLRDEHPEVDRDTWAGLIRMLHPQWLVLRPSEIDVIKKRDRRLLSELYQRVKLFDVTTQIDALGAFPGKGYLRYDQVFEVYHRVGEAGAESNKLPGLTPITLSSVKVGKVFSPLNEDGETLLAHVPAIFRREIPAGARVLSGGFGFFAGAYENAARHTPGAEFKVYHQPREGEKRLLYSRVLTPAEKAEDRGDQSFLVNLPEGADGDVEFEISDRQKGNEFGWTYWKHLAFETPPAS